MLIPVPDASLRPTPVTLDPKPGTRNRTPDRAGICFQDGVL